METTSSAREFAQLLGPLRRAVLKTTRQAAGLPDLSEPQIEVLRLLSNEGPAAPSHIAAALQMATSTLSNLLKAMTDTGLIERTRRADDQRRVDVAISSLARELLDTYDVTSLRTIENFLADLDDHERAAFEAAVPILRRMCATFADTTEHATTHG
ncbi:MarR family winged helix-turn-helix transcriptional regulator [Nocardia xishanensis]|uniref:MarR family winged helix-turn-helix transcriptional regulator n=1 Tax=Nocardia xishanensis TaxID=238964 RepID=A0ABW7XBI9_9NOCA